MSTIQRPFQSGSRQTPDPYDNFLDDAGYYRKHTARDSSCLFRTISEQLFDTQKYHGFVREVCVDYMTWNKESFQKSIKIDIDDYLLELSKPKTYGTLLELRAMAQYFKRNVLLFEAYNVGTWLVNEPDYDGYFSVFYTPERHFDSVFTKRFIENLAFCQSLCYQLIYSKVFKLPDVVYAVERMLHDPINRTMKYQLIQSNYDEYPEHICLDDGRTFRLDRPENTYCILENYRLCHFHNKNFKMFTSSLEKAIRETDDSSHFNKQIQSLLPEKYTSCVRQILDENITPFPYKVAKALDPDIYRNVEFDSWSEYRKEQRMRNWYKGGNDLQVGVKCHVKLRQSQQSLFNCHIQDMDNDGGPCLVFIEELGEKRTVPFAYLNPLPPDQVQPWPLPFRFTKTLKQSPDQKHSPFDSVKKRRLFRRSGKFRDGKLLKQSLLKTTSLEYLSCKESVARKLEPYTSTRNFEPPQYDIISMPVFVSNAGNNSKVTSTTITTTTTTTTTTSSSQSDVKQEIASNFIEESDFDVCQPNEYAYAPPYGPAVPFLYYPNYGMNDPNFSPYNMSGTANMPNVMSNPMSWINNGNNGAVMAASTGSVGGIPTGNGNPYALTENNLPPATFTSNCVPAIGGSGVSPNNGGQFSANYSSPNINIGPPSYQMASPEMLLIRRRDLLYSQYPINFLSKPSYSPNGSDVPINDMPTVRFFYNIGHEFSKNLQSKYGFQILRTLAHNPDNNGKADQFNNDMSNLASELNNFKFDKELNQSKSSESNNNRRYTANRNYKKDNKSRNSSSYQHKKQNNLINKSQDSPSLSESTLEKRDSFSGDLNPSNDSRNNSGAYTGCEIYMPMPSPYVHYRPYYQIDQQSMCVPPMSYGMYQQSNAFSYGPSTLPPQPAPSTDGSSIDAVDSAQYTYPPYQPHPQTFMCQPPHPPQAAIAIAPQGFWYPPPPISIASSMSIPNLPPMPSSSAMSIPSTSTFGNPHQSSSPN